MKRQQPLFNSVILDYQNKYDNNSKTHLIDQNLQSNLYLFLSIVHSNITLKTVFLQRCKSKDQFLFQFDHSHYKEVLTQVLQVFNQYFLHIKDNIQQYKPPNLEPKQHEFRLPQSIEKIQGMIKNVISTDLDALKNQIVQSQQNVQSWDHMRNKLNKNMSATTLLTQKLQQRVISQNGIDQMKQRILNLAQEHDLKYNYKSIRTEATPTQVYTSANKQRQPNRISFGQNGFSTDLILERSSPQYKQSLKCSPTFISPIEDRRDQANQTPSQDKFITQFDLSNVEIKSSAKQTKNSALLKSTQRKKSTSLHDVSEVLRTSKGTPQHFNSKAIDFSYLSIDDVHKKRKHSNTSARNFNILTNELID